MKAPQWADPVWAYSRETKGNKGNEMRTIEKQRRRKEKQLPYPTEPIPSGLIPGKQRETNETTENNWKTIKKQRKSNASIQLSRCRRRLGLLQGNIWKTKKNN